MLSLVWCPPGWCCGKLYLVPDVRAWRCPHSGVRPHAVLTDLDWLIPSDGVARRHFRAECQRKLCILAEVGQEAGLLGQWPTAQKIARQRKKDLRHLVRDVLGNPSRPLSPVPPPVLAWNDGIVKRLAEAAYAEQITPAGTLEPQRLAVLADALEEAGTDAELVAHLREPGGHYRGCWALDLLLGK